MPDFAIQHEFDSEPTYICESWGEGVTLGADIPVETRLKLAVIIRDYLNSQNGELNH